MPQTLETPQNDSNEGPNTKNDGSAANENSVKAHIVDLTTLYAMFFATENIYLKAGFTQVDVKTNESLATGGSYGDTTLDGYTVGLGFNQDMDNGMFVRFEASVMELDGATLVNKNDTTKKVTADGIEGVTAALSLGKTF